MLILSKTEEEYLKKLAAGDYSAEISPSLSNKKNGFGRTAKLLKRIHDNLTEHRTDLEKIANGELDITAFGRTQADEFYQQSRKIADNLSKLRRNAQTLSSQIDAGDTEFSVDAGDLSGCYREMMQAMLKQVTTCVAPLKEVNNALEGLIINDFSRVVTGAYRGRFQLLTDNMNEVCARLTALADSITKISVGDTSDLEKYKAIVRRSEMDRMIPAMLTMTQTVENIVSEVGTLSENAAEGKIIESRCDESLFQGRYKDVIRGFNETLETISVPLRDMGEVLNAIAANDYTRDMSDSYKGNFDRISQLMATVSTRLRYLQKVAVMVSQGDISELDTLVKIGKRSENDKLVPAFRRMMEVIRGLIGTTKEIADAAAGGNFAYRCDLASFSGEFKQIVENFDKMFVQIAGYIDEVSGVMTDMSSGDLKAKVVTEYHGQLGDLAAAVNLTSERLGAVVLEISTVITEISKGNLTHGKVRAYRGSFSAISQATNTILDSLNDVMNKIYVASEQVASGSTQVSDGSQNLSQGAAEQASSVEELTTSLSQISAQTKTNAENAGQASGFSVDVRNNAQTGKTRMDEMLHSMQEIREASGNISKIIKTIDDIAFQTNILSLNAAVEAARAGQYGKGFAVVAEEVRNLAIRSADASRETTVLIEGTVEKVNHGTSIADETAHALNGIVDGVDKVASFVSRIAAASNEQATAISQINQGILQVSQVVQTNSATAEESAAASEELSSQADTLKAEISHFMLREDLRAAI